jgi:hypothetical protein
MKKTFCLIVCVVLFFAYGYSQQGDMAMESAKKLAQYMNQLQVGQYLELDGYFYGYRARTAITKSLPTYTEWYVYIDVPDEVGYRNYYICVDNKTKKVLSKLLIQRDQNGNQIQ